MKSSPVLVTVLLAQVMLILLIAFIIKFIDLQDKRIEVLEIKHIEETSGHGSI